MAWNFWQLCLILYFVNNEPQPEHFAFPVCVIAIFLAAPLIRRKCLDEETSSCDYLQISHLCGFIEGEDGAAFGPTKNTDIHCILLNISDPSVSFPLLRSISCSGTLTHLVSTPKALPFSQPLCTFATCFQYEKTDNPSPMPLHTEYMLGIAKSYHSFPNKTLHYRPIFVKLYLKSIA